MGDTDFPTVMANYGMAKDRAEKWRSKSTGSSTYMQSGIGIPTTGEYQDYISEAGSDQKPYIVIRQGPIR